MEFDVGARLRAIREMHGLSQRELAKRAGVSNASVSLIEQNRSSPSVGSLKKVLDGIPMSLADFFSMEQAPREQVFFRAEDLTVISDGAIRYAQVGRDPEARALQILHEQYQPGADTGQNMLRHAAEEGGVVLRGRLEVTVETSAASWGRETPITSTAACPIVSAPSARKSAKSSAPVRRPASSGGGRFLSPPARPGRPAC